jgi:8-oxo-dGTP pyrophosphatase MutT (NUDIX family)
MIPEQLPLPRFKIPSKSPVAVFIGLKDVETDDPKLLLAQRPSGRYTLPGGKLKLCEKNNPEKTTIREVREETGWEIFNREYLIGIYVGNPVTIAVDGCQRDISLFFGFTDECMSDNTPQHREPTKNTPWEWISVRRIPILVASGLLHPVLLKANLPEIVAEANEVTIEEDSFPKQFGPDFDFPHTGLHPEFL